MKKKILVVDDEPGIVDLLRDRLVASGYEVIAAANGVTALEKARNELPDLIILDMMLPDIQGSSICARLKADERYELIPIIILSARDRDYDKDIGRAVKADAYLTKPFQPEQLLAKVAEFLKK